MRPINSLHDFFIRSAAEVRLYHLGRRVEPCDLDTLAAFEAGEAPWPAPWQGEACLGLVFRLGDLRDPLIWFLALPIDEQGHLVPDPRDAFLQRLLETLGRSSKAPGGEDDNLMKDNPLAFTPALPFRAVLHARASRDLRLPASQHLEPVEAYLTGQQALDWRAMGLQGLADFVVRMEEETSAILAERLGSLPDEVLTPLCYCLEHVAVGDDLALALCRRGDSAAGAGDTELVCACVRAIGGASETTAGPWYTALLDDRETCGPDLLAAIAARGWRHLEEGERLALFLHRLAEDPAADFIALARDLALIPRLRLPVLMMLRDAEPESTMGRRLAVLPR